MAHLVALVGGLLAAQPTVPGGPGSSALAVQSPLSQRLATLEAALSGEERRFQTWRWSWAATYAALAAGNLIALPFVSRQARIDYYTGAVTSAAAVAPTLLFMQPAPPSFHEGATADTRLEEAEARLAEVAQYQRDARGWKVHALNVAINAAVSAFLGFGFDRWQAAGINLVGGTALGELQILTHPDRASSFTR